MNFLFIEEIILDVIDENIHSNKCDKCQKPFSTKSNLRKHISKVHDVSFFVKEHFFLSEPSKNKVCPNCMKIFTQASNYNKRMTIYDDITYSCDQCDKKYTNKWSLNRHMKFHDNPDQSTCGICNKIFSAVANLKQHINSYSALTK